MIEKDYFEGNSDTKNNLKYITELYYLSKESGLTQWQLYSVFEESRILYINGDFDASLAKINEGISLARSQNDYNILCRLLLVYQRLLLKISRLSDSKKILKKCEEYNKLVTTKNDRLINNIYILLAKADIIVNKEEVSKDMNLVLSYKREAYSQALMINDSNKYKKFTVIFSLESLAWSLALSKNLDEAKIYTSRIDDLLAIYPNDILITKNLVIKGAIENIERNHTNATKYLSQAISLAKKNNNVYTLFEIYPMISASYGELKDFENATLYAWKYKHISDSIDLAKSNMTNINLIDKINIQVFEKKEKNQIFNTNILLAAIIAITLFGAAYFLYNRYKTNTVKENNPIINEIVENKEEVENEKNNSQSLPDKELENIRKLYSLVKADINLFYIEFHKIYPNFHQSLKREYPDLNISDLNFCSLIKMNFEIKQIAIYTNVSTRSIESRRYRILRKMQLKNQSDLYIILQKLI